MPEITGYQQARPSDVYLIEQMADAISKCSDLLNGRDQMLDAIAGGERSTKSPLTKEVDAALQAWREWRFG